MTACLRRLDDQIRSLRYRLRDLWLRWRSGRRRRGSHCRRNLRRKSEKSGSRDLQWEFEGRTKLREASAAERGVLALAVPSGDVYLAQCGAPDDDRIKAWTYLSMTTAGVWLAMAVIVEIHSQLLAGAWPEGEDDLGREKWSEPCRSEVHDYDVKVWIGLCASSRTKGSRSPAVPASQAAVHQTRSGVSRVGGWEARHGLLLADSIQC